MTGKVSAAEKFEILIEEYFALVAGMLVAVAAVAWGFIRKSVVSGLLAGAGAAAAAIIGLFALGAMGAAVERLEDLRDRAKDTGTNLPRILLQAWAWGLIQWIPPRVTRNEYLFTWACLLGGLVYLLPRLHALTPAGKLGAALAFVMAAAAVNAAFFRGDGD